MERPRITLLGRPGCHLCEYAREALERVRAATGAAWVEVNVDSDPELERDYGGRVPVILLDGREHCWFRVEEERLRRDLAAGRGGTGARRHLVWDWNGTLVDDLSLVIEATNVAFASAGGPTVTADEHRRDFRRPIVDYYAHVLGRPVDETEFARLDKVFHDAYQAALAGCRLTADAEAALRGWPGSQSLLSMWFHDELLLAVAGYGLTGQFCRIDGRRPLVGAVDHKAPHLAEHLAALGLDPDAAVLIGDTVDDAVAAAEAGAGCVLYSGGFTHPDQLHATGVPVADSLVEAVTLARTL